MIVDDEAEIMRQRTECLNKLQHALMGHSLRAAIPALLDQLVLATAQSFHNLELAEKFLETVWPDMIKHLQREWPKIKAAQTLVDRPTEGSS